MDELKQIRNYIEGCPRKSITDKRDRSIALEALTRLEAQSYLGGAEIVARIRSEDINNPASPRLYRYGEPYCGALIGQYAYRYSEDIRKERDLWQGLAMQFHDAVHAEVEKRKGCEI
jgi:hypothetical protein